MSDEKRFFTTGLTEAEVVVLFRLLSRSSLATFSEPELEQAAGRLYRQLREAVLKLEEYPDEFAASVAFAAEQER